LSVVVSTFVRYQRFSGYADPRYPEGYWFGVRDGIGDGSAGTLQLQLVFTPATQLGRNTRIYSVEQVSYRTSAGVATTVELLTENMGRAILGVDDDHRIAILVVPSGIGVDSAVRGDQLGFLPLFLGSQRNVGTASTYTSSNGNTTGITETFSAQGYWWGPRSVLVDGGPQRPPSGLYPA